MQLSQRCSRWFLPEDQQRGMIYFLQGRVTLGESDSDGLGASVVGSRNAEYQVLLNWSDAASSGVLYASCDCPRCADYILCKHIWATMLALDDDDREDEVPGDGRLEVVCEPLELADDDDLGDPDRFPSGDGADARAARSWKQQLDAVRNVLVGSNGDGPGAFQRRQAWYRLDVRDSLLRGQLVIDLYQREARKNGELGKIKRLRLSEREIAEFVDSEDRELLGLLVLTDPERSGEFSRLSEPRHGRGVVPPMMYGEVLPRLCATGRFGWLEDDLDNPSEAAPLGWDGGPPWRFALEIERRDGERSVRITGSLERDGERRPLTEPVLLLAQGVAVFRDRLALLDPAGGFPFISLLRRDGDIIVPDSQIERMLDSLWSMPQLPEVSLPDELALTEVRPDPRPRVVFRGGARGSELRASVAFDYAGKDVAAGHQPAGLVDWSARRVVLRDLDFERAAMARLAELGLQPVARTQGNGRRRRSAQGRDPAGELRLAARSFPTVAEALIGDGWTVEAEGAPLRPPGDVHLRLASGIDWFELAGEIDFGGETCDLPDLLAAVRRGDRLVRLGDGSRGMLPEAWLERYAPLAGLATDADGAVRFLPSQAALLDALLAAEPSVDVDLQFRKIRDRLHSIGEIEPAPEPRGFRGVLRPYQRDGLGWLRYLGELGFGGCLADDMGLGKTVQVLALLQWRRARPVAAAERRPALIVAPRSLVYNWVDEAGRFTPRLRVLNYTGTGREELRESFADHDVIVTTYGTVRRDILALKEMDLDYAILDEAQAIKNSGSQAAKACRLLRARRRLALTGTPIENHIGELWSIFEFLNPGMLGRMPALKGTVGARQPDREALEAIARGLRPFILRRSKEQVLDDLPPKTEQTLLCELEGEQLRLYRQLRDHYRAALARRIADIGLERSKIQVLEALLRLRQAACHPGLIDPARDDEPSAKLETLLEQLEEVLGEGHKALVFSQFTRLLAIVRKRLDRQNISYEYLDGQTRDRQRRVENFQNDPDCRLFLISLKAGGVGLNLTAADYVFILDPWWNPAVEAQAVDRAHRIGQTRSVFAYRLICRDTVEEKIVALQGSKRDLADAILSADRSLIRGLSPEDLQLLLS